MLIIPSSNAFGYCITFIIHKKESSTSFMKLHAKLHDESSASISISIPTTKQQMNGEKIDQHNQKGNINAQAIFKVFEGRYGANMKSKEWSRARRYIYHATSGSKVHNKILNEERIIKVLSYLEQECLTSSLSSSSTIVPYIIQNIPRILKRNVDTQIKPTVEFLKELYNQNDMFYTAIQRNPNLLLINGVKSLSNTGNINRKRKKNSQSRLYFSTDDSDEMIIDDTITTIESYLLTSNLGLTKNSVGKLREKLYSSTSSISSIFSGEDIQRSQTIIEERIDPMIQYFLSTIYSNNTISSNNNNSEDVNGRKIVGKLISAMPNILTLNLQSNIIPKVEYLQTFCDKSGNENNESNVNFMINIYKKFPSVFGLSLNENIKPTVDLIKHVIEGSVNDVLEKECEQSTQNKRIIGQNDALPLRKILTQHPQLLGLSQSNLRRKVQYFNSIDYMDYTNQTIDKGDRLSLAARIMITSPSVYSLSLNNNIIATTEYLAKIWGVRSPSSSCVNTNLPGPKLADRLADYPLILTLSLEGNIQPTIHFYNRTGYIHLDEDDQGKDSIEANSNPVYLPARYLATSLFNRLLPRWNYYIVEESKRINNVESTQKKVFNKKKNEVESNNESILNVSPSAPPLHLIASATDTQFCKKMGYDEVLFKKFKEEAVPRLKFSSQFDTWLKTGRPIDL